MQRLSPVLVAGLFAVMASATADARTIRIEGAGRQQDISIGREIQVARSESGILLIGEIKTREPRAAVLVAPTFPRNLRYRRTSVEPARRSRSRRGFRYGEGLGYSPGTRNTGQYRTARFQYGSGIRYGSGFSYGGGGGYSGPLRYRGLDGYKPNIPYGGKRYGEQLRRDIGRQR